MYKVGKAISLRQITELFAQRNEHPYNLRYDDEFLQLFVNSARCGTESISYLGPKIWGMVPVYIIYKFKKGY